MIDRRISTRSLSTIRRCWLLAQRVSIILREITACYPSQDQWDGMGCGTMPLGIVVFTTQTAWTVFLWPLSALAV